MTVTNVRKDYEALTMTVDADFDAPIERVWQLWADPRLLERWWGPPTYPATVVDHDFTPGGTVTYYMTGPDGDRPRGWWRIELVDAPTRLRFRDGFADDEGNPAADMPTMTMEVNLRELGDGQTRMTVVTTFPSSQDMDQVLTMGAEEGMRAALEQIDPLLQSESTIS